MSDLRAGAWAALDALEAGDAAEATLILLAALEDGPGEEVVTIGAVVTRAACRVCGRRFEWPGLAERHEIVDHGFSDEDELDVAA